MKYLISLLFFTLFIHGQNSELNSDKILCEQIQSAIKYLKSDKELKTQNFRFNSTIDNGWDYEMYFSIEYVAYQLGIGKEEVFKFDRDKVNSIYKKLENISRESKELDLDCVRNKRNPNSQLSKLDENSLLLNVTTNRVRKSGSNGVRYLFFFDNGKITSVYKSNWIE